MVLQPRLLPCADENQPENPNSSVTAYRATYFSRISYPTNQTAVMRPPKRTIAMAISSMMKNMDRADQL